MPTFLIIIITVVATLLALFLFILFYHLATTEFENKREKACNDIDCDCTSSTCSPTRQSGYYWVKAEDEWEIAFFQSNSEEDEIGWYSIWHGYYDSDNDLEEINETQIKK
jgi:hypothetical protein